MDTLPGSRKCSAQIPRKGSSKNSKYSDFGVDVKINDILNLYVDNKKNIWVCKKSGILKYRYEDFPHNPIHYFKNISITDICLDPEGNYWLTTLENGVLLIPSFQFHTNDKTGCQRRSLRKSTNLSTELNRNLTKILIRHPHLLMIRPF